MVSWVLTLTTPVKLHTDLKIFREVDRSGDPDFFVRFMDEANKPERAHSAAPPRRLFRPAPQTRSAAESSVECGGGCRRTPDRVRFRGESPSRGARPHSPEGGEGEVHC